MISVDNKVVTISALLFGIAFIGFIFGALFERRKVMPITYGKCDICNGKVEKNAHKTEEKLVIKFQVEDNGKMLDKEREVRANLVINPGRNWSPNTICVKCKRKVLAQLHHLVSVEEEKHAGKEKASN